MRNEYQSLPPELKAAVMETAASMMPPKTVEEVRGSLDLTDDKRIRNSFENCLTVLETDPMLSGAICYNSLTDRVDIVKPMFWDRSTPAITDTDLFYLFYYFEKQYSMGNEKKIQQTIALVAHRHKYHPIHDYLNQLTWDGTERISQVLHHFLGADVNEYTYHAMRLFMLGAIKRVFHPGCKFESMLCLVGGQGAGKSTFFRFLAVRDEWFSDDLRKIDDDNVYRKLQGHWIIEMSEMIATANAKSIEEIKSFLSRPKETYKVPYATYPEDRPRQCVFGGTSNALDFLPLDRSGNRRFLPVMVYPDRAEVHILDDEASSRDYIDQLWAEAMTIYRRGSFTLTLPQDVEQYLPAIQQQFMPEDTKAGLIQGYLETFLGDQICSKQLYREALGNPFSEPRQWEIREINDIMNRSVTGWKPFTNPRYFASYGRQRGWERDNGLPTTGSSVPDGFEEIPEEIAQQMELPFKD